MDGAPLTPSEFGAAVTAITSAFGDPTRRDIYLHAREAAAGLTAAEAADRFDLHPNVARHHLDKLASGGYLEISVERVEGARAGRPSNSTIPTIVAVTSVPKFSTDSGSHEIPASSTRLPERAGSVGS